MTFPETRPFAECAFEPRAVFVRQFKCFRMRPSDWLVIPPPSFPFIALLLLRAPFEGLFHVVRRPFWAMLIWGNIYPSSLISQVVFPIGFLTENSL